MSNASASLLSRTTCPHCWNTFPPEAVLWVSAHTDLLGDPRLGPEKQQRFLPTRFDLAGYALDARGVRCNELACPRCHLTLPRGLVEVEPFFVSILGAPACGKSFFLAAMTWQLRQELPRLFQVRFQDASPTANQSLNEYEQSLFLNGRRDEVIPLASLIRKTELQGELYDLVMFGSQQVSYPRPFLFALAPTERHPNAAARQQLSRMLCLYDNAGEHFQPGMDSTQTQATRHLGQSRLLLFLFDPTQDPRFRARCSEEVNGAAAPSFAARQEMVLLEAIARIRVLANMPGAAKHPHPLYVIVTKYDVWAKLLGGAFLSEPPWGESRHGIHGLDVERIAAASRQVRELLLDTSPEIVHAAEGFASQVVYFPVSVLGRRPVVDAEKGLWAIKPRNLKPLWCTAPLLYGLSQGLKGLIPRRRDPGDAAAPGRRGGG
jgi:hypothetical protein